MTKNAVVVKVLIMGLIFALTLVAMPVGAASELPSGTDIQRVPPSQSAPPSPYGIGQLLATFSFDHSQCWAHGNPYWDDLWRPCGASAETPGKTIEEVWPTTVDYFEFTLPSDGWIILEVEWITDDHYTGSMEWALQKRDGTGEWSNIGVTHYATPVPSEYWDELRFNEDGNLRIWGGWLPEINPAETYQIFAWQRYDNWAPAYNNQFYFPAKGTIKVIFVPKPEDSDGDGVPDDIDECPGTPAGVAVDDKGCPVEAAQDSDGDGVPDDVDACPGTPAGMEVDASGCSTAPFIKSCKGEFVDVDFMGNGEFTPCEPGIRLGRYSKIITGLESEVVIEFPGGTATVVKEMSNFYIHEFIMSSSGITAKTNLRVGELDIKVDHRLRAVDFSVSSPTCVSSVRGTHFLISHKDDTTAIYVLEGEVEVTDINDNKTVYVGEGYSSTCKVGGLPSEPEPGECIPTPSDQGKGPDSISGGGLLDKFKSLMDSFITWIESIFE